MKPVVVLGTFGMIGSTLVRYLTDSRVPVIEVNRSGSALFSNNPCVKFDVLEDSVIQFVRKFEEETVFINLIGLIRHKIDADSVKSVREAALINSVFPRDLVAAVKERQGRVIQIATDCIFSGSVGSYSEGAEADPVDVYGQTKLRGESMSQNLMTLRVSVVGKEVRNHLELMDWVIHQELNAEIYGFKNHFWNGVTSLHFAKIVRALIIDRVFIPGTFHVVPKDKVCKFQLLSLIAAYSGRSDLNIRDFMDNVHVDRTLTTDFQDFNSKIWELAGYKSPPAIEAMLKEYFEWLRH
jgi:dTDP-4-dehydrorhamnose reductase